MILTKQLPEAYEDSTRAAWCYIQNSLFLIAGGLLTFVGMLPREISHSINLTMMPLALLLLMYNFRNQFRFFQGKNIWVTLYLIWNITVILRGIDSEFYPWKNPMQIWLVLLGPLYIGLILPAVTYMQFCATEMLVKIVKAAIWIAFVTIIIYASVYFRPSIALDDYSSCASAFAILFAEVWIASIPLFCCRFFSIQYRCAAWIVTFLCFMIAVLLARRGAAVSLGGILIAGFYFLPMMKKIKIALAVSFIIFSVLVLYVWGEQLYEWGEWIFFNIQEREELLESRSTAYTRIIEEASAGELLFGRGMFGNYYHDHFVFDDVNRVYEGMLRFSCESGCLDIILRGGIIALVLHCLALGGATVRGIFHAKSKIAKGMAFYILISLLELIPFGMQNFTLRMIAVWIFASMLYSEKFCSLSDIEIIDFSKHHVL